MGAGLDVTGAGFGGTTGFETTGVGLGSAALASGALFFGGSSSSSEELEESEEDSWGLDSLAAGAFTTGEDLATCVSLAGSLADLAGAATLGADVVLLFVAVAATAGCLAELLLVFGGSSSSEDEEESEEDDAAGFFLVGEAVLSGETLLLMAGLTGEAVGAGATATFLGSSSEDSEDDEELELSFFDFFECLLGTLFVLLDTLAADFAIFLINLGYYY